MMKLILSQISLFCFAALCLAAEPSAPTKLPEKKNPTSAPKEAKVKAVAQRKPVKAKPTSSKVNTPKTVAAAEPPKQLNKFPKAIFLIKRAKIDSDIGEPVIYPFDRELKNVYYDIPGGQLRND